MNYFLFVCNKLYIPSISRPVLPCVAQFTSLRDEILFFYYLLQIAVMQLSHVVLSDFFCALAPPDIHSVLLWTNNNAVPLILQALLTAYRTQADIRLLHSTSVAFKQGCWPCWQCRIHY